MFLLTQTLQHPNSFQILHTLFLYISFDTDEENLLDYQSFLGWWSFNLFLQF